MSGGEPGAPLRATILIRGRVQGVFFRASAREEALRLGLVGEVRNLPGGEVEAIAEGFPRHLEDFVAWCRRGPPMAHVEDVQVRYGPPQGGFRSFSVTR